MRIVPLSLSAVGTNEVAEVSVIEASINVWSCPCTHGCVLTTRKVIERRSANCRVVIGAPLPLESLTSSARSPTAVFCSAVDISKERGIANSIVTESGLVTVERKRAESAVE